MTTTHGGAREGAGRKPGSVKSDAKREAINVKLTQEEKVLALAIGDGNASEGIRRALASHKLAGTASRDGKA
jgi:hypothetical protein